MAEYIKAELRISALSNEDQVPQPRSGPPVPLEQDDGPKPRTAPPNPTMLRPTQRSMTNEHRRNEQEQKLLDVRDHETYSRAARRTFTHHQPQKLQVSLGRLEIEKERNLVIMQACYLEYPMLLRYALSSFTVLCLASYCRRNNS